jgi:hypothetical protein
VVGQTVTFEATGLPIYLPGISFPNASSVVISGQTVTVTYSTFGKQIIRIITPNPADYILNLEIKAPIKPYKSPDAIWTVKTLNNFDPLTANSKASYFSNTVNAQGVMNSTKGEAQAYIRFGKNHNGKIVRPIIYVDGIDFNSNTDIVHDVSLGGSETSESNIIRYGSTGWDVFAMGVEPSESITGETEAFRKYPEHFDKMYEEGYDVIFLDFKEGATYMQKNAEVLIELLKRINGTSSQSTLFPERKKVATNGILYENIVVGASMGGQVAKYALAKMEYEERNLSGPSHCTKMYVSFDSQHKGAVIPLGIQSAAWYASQTCLDAGLWNKLNQPAARQLLVEHLSSLVGSNEVNIRYTPTADVSGIVSSNQLGLVALESDNGMILNDVSQNTLPIFWTGFSNYLAGNENVTNNALAPLAALSMEERNAVSNPYAQHIIDIAKTLVYAAPTTTNNIGFQGKIQKNNGIKIYPNPTSDLFFLRLPKGSYEVSIFDPQGRNIKQFRSENEENTIETQTWKLGIYQALIKSENTGEVNQYKIVIVR